MRIVIDSLVAMMLAGILAGVVLHNRTRDTEQQNLELTRDNVAYIQRQIMLQAALGKAEVNERGYPTNVDPEWFGAQLPENPLLSDAHPWLEVAGLSQVGFEHPVDRVAIDRRAAKFWYNPSNGIVRARVPADISDSDALRTYNTINSCELPTLFAER